MSGSQVLPIDALYRETWDPESYLRLLKLIADSKASGTWFQLSLTLWGVILLSGDVHYSEFFKNDCASLNYPLYEFTASGLTHAAGDIPFGPFLIASTFSKWHLNYQTGRNFGIIDISWDDEEPVVSLQSRSTVTGDVVISQQILLKDIQYDATRERTNYASCFKQQDLGFLAWKRTPKHTLILGALSVILIVGFVIIKKILNFNGKSNAYKKRV